jgi:hypothetical protein
MTAKSYRSNALSDICTAATDQGERTLGYMKHHDGTPKTSGSVSEEAKTQGKTRSLFDPPRSTH